MKQNQKIDLRELKAKHRLEAVMAETGETLDPQGKSLTTPGLVVDTHRQAYELHRPGMDLETGDIFDWLKRRYGWTFGQVLRYLKERTPDDTQTNPPVISPVYEPKVETVPNSVRLVSDEDGPPLNRWQKKAQKIAMKEIPKYFGQSWNWVFSQSSNELLKAQSFIPSRFLPIVTIDLFECAECTNVFDWLDPGTVGYLVKGMEYGGEDMPEEDRNRFILDIYLEHVICEACRQRYIKLYTALDYCIVSADKRETAQWEAELAERQRQAEAEERDSLAAEEAHWLFPV